MKKGFTYLLFVILVSSFSNNLLQAQHSNCPAAPYTVTITQPDQSKITVKAFGGEAVHFFENTEGYTLLRNSSGFYEYAIADEQGNLTTSGIIARDGDKMKLGIKPHLRYSSTQVNLLMQRFNAERENKDLGKAGEPLPFPSTGDRKVIVLLVEFPDLRATISKENFELLLNQPQYNGTGSFKDFYLETSNGKLNLTSTVYGWIMAENEYRYYGRTSSPNYSAATRELLLDAVAKANDSLGVDFSEYDNDKDGFVDGVIIMHAGLGAEEVSAPNSGDYIWSFRSTLAASLRPTYDSVDIAAFAMFPEKRWNGGNETMVGIGVLSHEFGHLLDLPDLYSTQSTNEGAGNYCLMAGGPWLNNERTPCLNNAWCRIQMGWVKEEVIEAVKTYTLPFAVVDSDMVYRINTERINEYYLLENRQRKGFDMYVPSRGLAIWHINTTRALLLSKASSSLRNNVNNDTSQLGVGLIQADGFRHLEREQNRGDGSDLYPLNTNRNFTPTTSPASNLHFRVNNVRQPSGVAITDIIQQADSSIIFELGMNASAAFNPNRLSGCAPLTVGFNNVSSGADAYLWDFGDGTTALIKTPSKVFSSTGTYTVKLTIFNSGIPIDSSSLNIRVLETPIINYTWDRDSSYRIVFNNQTQMGNSYIWIFNLPDTSLRSNDVAPILQLNGPLRMQVRVTATSKDGCISSRNDSVPIFTVGLNTAVQQKNKDEILVYPNPFENNMLIQSNSTQEVDIIVYDITGKEILSEPIKTNDNIRFDTTTWPSGLYFVTWKSNGSVNHVKVCKP